MKILLHLCVTVMLVSANIRFMEQDEIYSLSIVFETIMEKLATEFNRVHFRIYGTNYGLPELDEIMKVNKKFPIHVMRFSHLKVEEIAMNESAIMIMESENFFWFSYYKQNMWRAWHSPLRLFVYLKGATVETLNKIGGEDNYWRTYRTADNTPMDLYLFSYNEMRSMLTYQYFIINETNSIKIYIFVWYTQENCSKPQLAEVNAFDKNSKTWKNSELIIKKFHNFYGCDLVFGYDASENLRFSNSPVDGRKIINNLQVSLNFTMKSNILYYDATSGTYFFKIANYSVDFVIEQTLYNYARHYHFAQVTQPYFFSPLRLAVPPGEPYDAYEKLLLPFDEDTWILIGFTFVAAFSTILIMKFFNKTIRDFVLGHNVETPALNVVMLFCGISQVVLPRRNFARFLVMSYILYSLIIRTAWQSKMFEFLQKEMRKPEVKSFKDMVAKGFKLIVFNGFQYMHNDSAMEISVQHELNFTALDDLFMKKIYDHNFRRTLATSIRNLNYYAKLSKGEFLNRILPNQVLYTEMVTQLFPHYHKFYEVIDEKIQQLISAGLVNYILQDFDENENKKMFAHLHVEEPQVLTMKHLEAGFVVWLVSVSFAVIAFLLEIICRTARNVFF